METILVPEDRAGVINISVISKIKRDLGIVITKNKNSISIAGEGLEFLLARNVILAIGRGFSPVRAYRLLDEEQELYIIQLGKHAQRIRARLIGTKGKCRKQIERYTGAAVSIYGKTVALIGDYKQLQNAKKAVQLMIDGSSHIYVYRFLEDLEN